ncbi:MAG: undecaprenyl-phosphate galactose phosphotransferase WbaP [Anaerolineaceae bacterium]|nr:undecaprenyl-phosphate galactose phosphotransferase WbaP [Anaerolineaceae bacterium]
MQIEIQNTIHRKHLKESIRILSGYQQNARFWMTSAFFFTDFITHLFSAVLAVWLRVYLANWEFLNLIEPQIYAIQKHFNLWPILFFFIIVYAIAGLYPGNGMGRDEEIKRLSIFSSIIFFGLITFIFFTKTQLRYSRAMVGFYWIFTLILMPISRMSFRFLFTKAGIWGEPVAIISNTPKVRKLITHLQKEKNLGFIPAVLFDSTLRQKTIAGIPRLQASDLIQFSYSNNINEAFIYQGDTQISNQVIAKYQAVFGKITILNTQAIEQLSWVTIQDPKGIMGYELKQNLRDTGSGFTKRLIDLLSSSFGLILLSPIFLFVGTLIRLDSEGGTFYHQERIGKNGQKFKMLKFRTMHKNADEMLTGKLAADPEMKAEWEKYQKLKNDPRITNIGKILRRLSIDELPQLINVFLGQMSLVGPRPFPMSQYKDYGESYFHYIQARPGITGLWQVSGRNLTTFAERAKWDEYYVRYWSIWIDFSILLRTFWAIINAKGAY